jgi:hypothetical protein
MSKLHLMTVSSFLIITLNENLRCVLITDKLMFFSALYCIIAHFSTLFFQFFPYKQTIYAVDVISQKQNSISSSFHLLCELSIIVCDNCIEISCKFLCLFKLNSLTWIMMNLCNFKESTAHHI